jgi:hypothetical protein
MTKIKRTNHDLQNTSQKTKDRDGDKHSAPVGLNNIGSTSDTRRDKSLFSNIKAF